MASIFRSAIKVDPEDQHIVDSHLWYTHGKGEYVTTKINGAHVPLHVIIFGTDRISVDHIDRDKFNNSRSNLRQATQAEQCRNRGLFKNSTSGFKGVSWHKQSNKFRAKIHIDGRSIHLGSFDDPTKAAKAYDAAAIKYHGEFACLNFSGDKIVSGVKNSPVRLYEELVDLTLKTEEDCDGK